MEVQTINGNKVEIATEEAKRIFQAMNGIGGPGVNPRHGHSPMPEAEMKDVADSWWNQFGKKKMEVFFTEYQNKAAESIRTALGHSNPPKCEKEIKGAIAQALDCGNPDLVAEVIFEAMEWESAYHGLKSIED